MREITPNLVALSVLVSKLMVSVDQEFGREGAWLVSPPSHLFPDLERHGGGDDEALGSFEASLPPNIGRESPCQSVRTAVEATAWQVNMPSLAAQAFPLPAWRLPFRREPLGNT